MKIKNRVKATLYRKCRIAIEETIAEEMGFEIVSVKRPLVPKKTVNPFC